jgi:hypothetical protein
MLQGIEKKRETKPLQVLDIVMLHGRKSVLGSNGSLRAREDAAPSLSGLLAGISHFDSDVSSQSAFLTLMSQLHPSRDRTRSRSLSHTEKFSAEEPMARSALAVSAASPNTRSPQAAATVTTTMTEQRRCAAA